MDELRVSTRVAHRRPLLGFLEEESPHAPHCRPGVGHGSSVEWLCAGTERVIKSARRISRARARFEPGGLGLGVRRSSQGTLSPLSAYHTDGGCRKSEGAVRPRALLIGGVGLLVLVAASPASAKVAIAEARITGPGLEEGGLSIAGQAAEGMWEAGIDVASGLDDARVGSIGALGLPRAELGPRYFVTYRFSDGTAAGAIAQQELYPYANGGPVTYTPRGQFVARGQPWGGRITAGWLQSSPEFLRYLVEQGLPETAPQASVSPADRTRQPLVSGGTPWVWMALGVTGLMIVSFSASRFGRRLPAA